MYTTGKTLQLIKEYVGDNHCLELLRFFGRYSRARFNRLAIVHGLYNGNAHSVAHSMEKALKRLVENKLICSSVENGIVLYSLTEDELARDIICNFATLDLPQWQIVLKDRNSCLGEQPDSDLRKSNKPLSLTSPILRQTENSLLSMAVK
jgi:hypothetical protein